MKHSIFLMSLVLTAGISGCATFSANPDAETKIPVAVACQTPDPNIPTSRFSPPYDDIFSAVRDLLGDRENALGYENQLRAALASCK